MRRFCSDTLSYQCICKLHTTPHKTHPLTRTHLYITCYLTRLIVHKRHFTKDKKVCSDLSTENSMCGMLLPIGNLLLHFRSRRRNSLQRFMWFMWFMCAAKGHVCSLSCANCHANRWQGVGTRPPKRQKFPPFGKESPRPISTIVRDFYTPNYLH